MLKVVDYYKILGVAPTARERDIRQAYRSRCRDYHPDTTTLSETEALEKFHALNEAYGILSNPMKRIRYDQQLMSVRASQQVRTLSSSGRVAVQPTEIQERALSSAEMFALFILGIAFLSSLLLVGFVSITRGWS